jgi:hypothetical protein
MKPIKLLGRDEIIQIAKRKGGFFTVDRYSYRQEKLRKKLKAMSKQTNCPLKFYALTRNQIIYSL